MPRKSKQSPSSPQELVPSEDKAGKDAKFASQAYNKVARSAKLQSINLTSSQFYVKPEFLVGEEEGINSRLSYSCEISEMLYDADEGIAACEWKWVVSAKTGRKKSLYIEAVYFIAYDELTGCEQTAVERFLKRVARFASYPYFRAHVSQASWESGANLPILPTIST